MISVLLGLVITAAVTAVIYNQFNDASRKSVVEAAVSDLTSIIGSAKKVYGTANQYLNITTATAVQGGIIPPRLRVTGTNTAQNNYNGAITFVPATISSASDSLDVGFARIASTDCQDVVLSVESLARGITVAGQQVKPNDGSINMATLTAACDSAANVDAVFRIGRN